MDGRLKDYLVVGVDADLIVVQHAMLGEGAHSEADPVELPCHVEPVKSVDIFIQEQASVTCSEDESFVKLLSAHGECVVGGRAVEESLVEAG